MDLMDVILSKKVLGVVLIIIGFGLFYFVFKKIIKRVLKAADKRRKTLISLVTNVIKYFFFIVAILMILNIYGIDTTALITSLGVVGLVAGLALQDILKDFLAGIAIITEDQYQIGDIVTINGFKGEILSLGMKTTKLKDYNGDVKFISNGTITEVINHSISSSRAIINLNINYKENIDKVEKILYKLFDELNKEIKDLKSEIQILGVEDLGESSVVIKIVADTKPMRHYDVERILRKRIKEELDKNKIEIPYNQLVVHNG